MADKEHYSQLPIILCDDFIDKIDVVENHDF